MKTLVFSDIHGNALALDAMLEDVRGESFDGMVCLGDAIQSGPQPAETVSRLRELGCPVVMGNADDWLLTGGDKLRLEFRRVPLDVERLIAVYRSSGRPLRTRRRVNTGRFKILSGYITTSSKFT
jgi:predicted phosphodiesterase